MAEQLNPGIRKVVALLNEHGWRTCDSGDGETRDYDCDRDAGYVVVRLEDWQPMEGSADDLRSLLESHGVRFGEGATLIQASYSPIDGVRLVDIHGIHDRMLTT